MAGKPGYHSTAIDQTMEMQIGTMKTREMVRQAEVIDKEDDDRRKRKFATEKWIMDSHSRYSKKISELMLIDDMEEMQKKLVKLSGDFREFKDLAKKKLEEMKVEELYYEELDDKVRNNLAGHAEYFENKCREMSSITETRAIKDKRPALTAMRGQPW